MPDTGHLPTLPFESVLVANRGEIAVRIIRTLRALGLRSVAVFSDADRDAPHVAAADVAVRIGPAPAAQSYLSVERVIEAAQRTGADAVHPGYGFLSESAAFAVACARSGIVFVGPPPAAIEAMGDKISAKHTVARHGVRVVPGASGRGLNDEELLEAARAVGLPLLIKPSAGGGGKGMRLVRATDQLAAEIAAARREARTAFGDDTLLVERYVERPRHIEVQVLADTHGSVVHLGERECTLQRRHQKVIEEAPSPYLTASARATLGEQAIAAARACGYVGAGTVEFIVSGASPDDAYFLEMNTRLQVEHPVTEMVWGIDLVEQQLRVAAGEPLGFEQDDLRPNGHAFEARVYAEDPAAGFLPTGGTVALLREPSDVAHVRVDSSLRPGTVVGSDYDPMLSKVIAWGTDRDEARRRLDRALSTTAVLGVTTNIAFLRTLLADADVAAGVMDTGLIERLTESLPPAATPPDATVAAALAVLDGTRRPGPWGMRDGWRVGRPAWISWRAVGDDGAPVEVRLRSDGERWDAEVGQWSASVSATYGDGHVALDLDGVRREYAVTTTADAVWVGREGNAWQLFSMTDSHGTVDAAASGALVLASPMPGTVTAINVAVGDEVAAGQVVVVVEAMKMEHALRAPLPTRVREIGVGVGDRVALRQVLAVLDPATTTPEPNHPGDPMTKEPA